MPRPKSARPARASESPDREPTAKPSTFIERQIRDFRARAKEIEGAVEQHQHTMTSLGSEIRDLKDESRKIAAFLRGIDNGRA